MNLATMPTRSDGMSRQRRQNFAVADEPLGYVDGPNVYGVETANPVSGVDPMGLAGTVGAPRPETQPTTKPIVIVPTTQVTTRPATQPITLPAGSVPQPHTVIVYIWPSSTSGFGHVSIMLPNGKYVSWWPRVRSIIRPTQPAIKGRTFDDDQDSEKQDPRVYVVKGLNTDKMEEEWRAFNEKETLWMPLAQQCATLSLHLLQVGEAPGIPENTVGWNPTDILKIINGDPVQYRDREGQIPSPDPAALRRIFQEVSNPIFPTTRPVGRPATRPFGGGAP